MITNVDFFVWLCLFVLTTAGHNWFKRWETADTAVLANVPPILMWGIDLNVNFELIMIHITFRFLFVKGCTCFSSRLYHWRYLCMQFLEWNMYFYLMKRLFHLHPFSKHDSVWIVCNSIHIPFNFTCVVSNALLKYLLQKANVIQHILQFSHVKWIKYSIK